MAKSAPGESAIWRLSEGLLARFIQSSKGGIAVGIAVASPALLAVVGLAADYAVSTMKVAELQAAADAAAIAGANELALSGSAERSIESAVQSYVAAQDDSGKSHITSLAKIDRTQGTVQVVVNESWTPVFAHFLNANVTPIRVNATARLMGKTKICVLILNGAEAQVLHLDNDAKLTANDCGVYSNSKHAEGIRLDANTRITSTLTCSAGGFRAKNDSIKPFPLTDCPPVPDPLTSRSPPLYGLIGLSPLASSNATISASPNLLPRRVVSEFGGQVHIGASFDKELRRFRIVFGSGNVERCDKAIGFVGVDTAVQRRGNRRDIVLPSGVVNGGGMRCQWEQTKT